jgi:hypothetical protein
MAALCLCFTSPGNDDKNGLAPVTGSKEDSPFVVFRDGRSTQEPLHRAIGQEGEEGMGLKDGRIDIHFLGSAARAGFACLPMFLASWAKQEALPEAMVGVKNRWSLVLRPGGQSRAHGFREVGY